MVVSFPERINLQKINNKMASEQKGREHFIDEKGKVPSLAGW